MSETHTTPPMADSIICPSPRFVQLEGNVKPRQWVAGKRLLKEGLSAIIAPSGLSKSTFAMHLAMAIVTGRSDIVGMDIPTREKVWLFSNEDDRQELDRRLKAACMQHSIDAPDLRIDGRKSLFINSGVDRPLQIAIWSEDRKLLEPFDMDEITAQVKTNGIGVLIVDPFSEMYPGNDVNRVDVGAVARMFRTIARKANCAVLLVHRTCGPECSSAEGCTDDEDNSCGTTALMNAANTVMTLGSMSSADAKLHGVSQRDRYLYIRLDDSKSNVARLSIQPTWFRRVSVQVETSVTARTGKFESVGALELANFKT